MKVVEFWINISEKCEFILFWLASTKLEELGCSGEGKVWVGEEELLVSSSTGISSQVNLGEVS